MSTAATTRLVVAASELGGVAEVAREVLPELTRSTHATLVFFYEACARRGMVTHAPPGTPDWVGEYFRHYVADCPLHRIKEKVDGAVIPTTRLAARTTSFAKTAVYNDLFRPWGLDHHLVARLLPANAATGAAEVGLIINRDRRRGEYSDEEVRMVEALVPSLSAALRRAAQLDEARGRIVALEALLVDSGDDKLKVVLDTDGRIVHAHAPDPSVPAGAVLDALGDRAHPVRVAAMALAAQSSDAASIELSHLVSTSRGDTFRAELSRTEALLAGQPFVIVTLSPLSGAPAAWARWHLTRAETAILTELVAGGTNLEIGGRLFVSPETVRTHLTRIFKKMSVRSRLEAVVLATRAEPRGALVRRIRGTA